MSDGFETHIRDIAQHLPYPAMPAREIHYRRRHSMQWMRQAAAILIVMVIAGFAIPDIRASVFKMLQIGAVTITLDGSSLSGEPLRLSDVSGETDLATIQENVSYAIRVPPDNLPDRVYLQESELVIFVWLEDDDIQQVLYQLPLYDWGVIKSVETVTHTTVENGEAFWIDIAHPVIFENGTTEMTYFVQGNVLIWMENNVTYRLETALDMDEARVFAESLDPSP